MAGEILIKNLLCDLPYLEDSYKAALEKGLWSHAHMKCYFLFFCQYNDGVMCQPFWPLGTLTCVFRAGLSILEALGKAKLEPPPPPPHQKQSTAHL